VCSSDLFHSRHDWSSIVSCFLQVLIYRKKPMTLDERLPFFLFFTSLPLALAWFYLQGELPEAFASPLWISAGLFVSCLWLGFVGGYSKKNKGMFDWNIVDSIILGIAHLGVLLPGIGRPLSLIGAGLSRNYALEPTVKYSLYATLPFLMARALTHWSVKGETSTLTLLIAAVVSFAASFFAIGGIQKSAQKGSLKPYVIYGILLASALFAFQFLK
jgi:undecaprenyl pyrophosphate phosphatase UppP